MNEGLAVGLAVGLGLPLTIALIVIAIIYSHRRSISELVFFMKVTDNI
jgi:hypothetical protein